MPIQFTEPDAERLSVLHCFVRNAHEGENLRNLEKTVTEAQIVAPERIPPDVVTMNSRVLLADLESGCRAEYTLVFPAAADARRKRISVLGSLGSALLGRRAGEVIEYVSSAGRERCRIERVVYQPEAHGDYSS